MGRWGDDPAQVAATSDGSGLPAEGPFGIVRSREQTARRMLQDNETYRADREGLNERARRKVGPSANRLELSEAILEELGLLDDLDRAVAKRRRETVRWLRSLSAREAADRGLTDLWQKVTREG